MEHTSTQYERDLEAIRARLLDMGGLVEAQVRDAVRAFAHGDRDLMDRVAHNEQRVNQAEIEIDDCCNHVIAKRQPAAGDLRLIVGVIQAVTDLERIGDESEKIGRMARQIYDRGAGPLAITVKIRQAGETSAGMLNRTLNAFARLDAGVAAGLIREDLEVDAQFRSILRELITYMMEDPRTITTALDMIWVAKAIERVGDHAKNIAEHVIFIVQGTDVRHAPHTGS
jgi:phosphate transport system protein